MSSLPATAIAANGVSPNYRTSATSPTPINITPATAVQALPPGDRVQFSSNRNGMAAAQPGLIRKYAWPATLVTMGSVLGLTGALFAWTGIGVFGHLIGLGLLGLGLHKGWKAFREAEDSLPQHHLHHEHGHGHSHADHDLESPPVYNAQLHPGERQLDPEEEPAPPSLLYSRPH